jgi:hypothetical protein
MASLVLETCRENRSLENKGVENRIDEAVCLLKVFVAMKMRVQMTLAMIWSKLDCYW